MSVYTQHDMLWRPYDVLRHAQQKSTRWPGKRQKPFLTTCVSSTTWPWTFFKNIFSVIGLCAEKKHGYERALTLCDFSCCMHTTIANMVAETRAIGCYVLCEIITFTYFTWTIRPYHQLALLQGSLENLHLLRLGNDKFWITPRFMSHPVDRQPITAGQSDMLQRLHV